MDSRYFDDNGMYCGPEAPPEEDERWEGMESAPRDGTIILGLYEDGIVDRVYWATERCCILGRRTGSMGDGWISDEVKLPADPPKAWQPAGLTNSIYR